jgi:hypothetical protein
MAVESACCETHCYLPVVKVTEARAEWQDQGQFTRVFPAKSASFYCYRDRGRLYAAAHRQTASG